MVLQIRQNEELFPIAYDSNVDSSYQDFRRLALPVRSLPGDRLVAECIYDSSSRKAITLGKCFLLNLKKGKKVKRKTIMNIIVQTKQ